MSNSNANNNIASRDENNVPTLLGVSSTDGVTPVAVYVNPTTHRMLVDETGSGGGAVSSVSNSDGTLTISPTTGAVVASLALGQANTWTNGATFTNGAAVNIANLDTVLYADQYSGSDIGAQINSAYAALPSTGGTIMLPSGTFSFSTPIVFNTNNKFVSLKGPSAASTLLNFTPTSGNAITFNDGNPIGHLRYEVTGFTLMGKSTLVAAGNTNTNTSIGIYYGGTNGAAGINTHDTSINGFGTNWLIGQHAYMLSFNDNANSGGNGGQASMGALLHMNVANDSGERNVFDGNSFTDPGNSLATNAIYITQAGTASNFFTNNSFDNAQIYIASSNGQIVISYNHFENPGKPSVYPAYIPIQGISSDKSTQITFIGNEIANSASNVTFATIIQHGGQLFAVGNHIDNYNGSTITNFVDHSLDNGLSAEIIGMTQVQGGGLTNLIAGSGGVTYSQAIATGFTYNVGNSYSIGLAPSLITQNTNYFYSGNATTGTFDHAGNWVLGTTTSSTVTTKGSLTVQNLTTAGIVKTSVAGLLSVATAGTDYVSVNSGTTGQYASTNYALTDGSTIALNWNNGNEQYVTIAGNRTFTFANPIAGGRYLIALKQDATGSRTITWPTITWRGGSAPTLTTTASKTDLITLVYLNGVYYGDASLNY